MNKLVSLSLLSFGLFQPHTAVMRFKMSKRKEKFKTFIPYCVDVVKCYFICIFVKTLAYRISDISKCLDTNTIIVVIVIVMNGKHAHAHSLTRS